MGKKFDFRFGVRNQLGEESSVWKCWASQAGDVYLATRSMVGVQKFSFHVSCICRHALINPPSAKSGRLSRLLSEWTRNSSPDAGQRSGSWVLNLQIPSGYLSRPRRQHTKSIYWIDAAQSSSILIEFFFTRESERDIRQIFAKLGARHLALYSKILDEEAFAIAHGGADWDQSDLRLAESNIDFGALFSPSDPLDTGRPLRLTMFPPPPANGPAWVIEVGGYGLGSKQGDSQ